MENLYGKSITIELRKFGERDRYMIKHEFNEILFRHTMKRFEPASYVHQVSNDFYTQPSFTSLSNQNQLFNLQSPNQPTQPISPISPIQQNKRITTDRNASYNSFINN